MVSRRTAACQYGSRDELAIIDARHATPIDTSSPDGVVRPLWQAMQLSEVWNATRCRRRAAVGASCGGAAAPDERQRRGSHADSASPTSDVAAVIASRPTIRRRTSPTGNR